MIYFEEGCFLYIHDVEFDQSMVGENENVMEKKAEFLLLMTLLLMLEMGLIYLLDG
jgi:hypothetical protein